METVEFLVLVLVLGVAVEGTTCATECATYSGTFQCVTGLVTDDAACCCTEESTTESTALGVWAGWSGAVAESDAGDTCDDKKR